MLTPQEVSERGFTKVSFGGYNMVQVDEFLDILTGDYTTLYSENTALKRKMKVMQDKIDEYRTTEETMRKALLAAQQIAETMVQEGKTKTQQLMDEARQEIEALRKTTLDEREQEEQRLQAVKQVTAQYVEQVRALHQKETEYLDSLGVLAYAETMVPPAPQSQGGHGNPPAGQTPNTAPNPQNYMPSMPQTPPTPQMPAMPQQMPPSHQAPPQGGEGSMSHDVQAFLERALADTLGEKKAAELSEDNYQNFQHLYQTPPAQHVAHPEPSSESIESTTRFLMGDDLENSVVGGSRQIPSPVGSNEYEAELAQTGGSLDFNHFQQKYGQNNPK